MAHLRAPHMDNALQRQSSAYTLTFFRVLSALGAAVLFSVGIIRDLWGSTEGAISIARLGVVAVCLLFLWASYKVPRVRNNPEFWAIPVVIAVAGWAVLVAHLQAWSQQSALVVFVALFGCALAFTTRERMAIYQTTIISLTAASLWATEQPETDPVAYLTALVAVCALTLFVIGQQLVTQRLLAHNRAVMTSMFTESGDALVLVRAEDLGILMRNDAVITLFETDSEEELTNLILAAILPQAPSSERRDQAIDLGQKTNVGTREEVEMSTARGERFWADISTRAVQDGDERLWLIRITNISQAKQIQSELRDARDLAEAAVRARSQFLANMSHEIRTPMNGVIGMTSLLMDSELDEAQREFVETIRVSGESLLTIINDILDFSKVEAGAIELETHPFQVEQCVAEAMDILRPKASDKGLELACYVEPHVPTTVLGDVTRLRQVLVNLVSNAVKFTLDGEVAVFVGGRSLPDGEFMLECQVRDTGIGITPSRIPALFEPFTQADASTTRRHGGTGLGLTISRKLVELMGGTISATSQVHVGTSFHFSARVSAAPEVDNSLLERQGQQLEGRHVLVVDDNSTNRRVLQLLLERWGLHATLCESGDEALAALAGGLQPDLSILDMQMPGMNGVDLARAIHSTYPAAKPCLLLSSIGTDVDAPELFSVRMNKPVRSGLLYEALLQTCRPEEDPVAMVAATAAADHPQDAADVATQPAAAAANTTATEPAAATPLEASDADRPESFRGRVLLAEDNLVNRKVALTMLGKLGIKADVATTGVEALDACRSGSYDLVFMDVQMPDMDGLEATRAIRLLADIPQPVIVAMTANAMEGDRNICLAAGMDDYLSKPIKLATVASMLQRHTAQGLPASDAPDLRGAANG